MSNREIIKSQIQLKENSSDAYFASPEITKSVATQMNHYPYTKFFTGVYNSSKPVVFEREAGYKENTHVREIVLAQQDPVIKNDWQYSSGLVRHPINDCLFEFV